MELNNSRRFAGIFQANCPKPGFLNGVTTLHSRKRFGSGESASKPFGLMTSVQNNSPSGPHFGVGFQPGAARGHAVDGCEIHFAPRNEPMVETLTFVGIWRGISKNGFLSGGAKWISPIRDMKGDNHSLLST